MMKTIFEHIEKEGGKTFYVGGYVRDLHLGLKPKDIDIEVYNITPNKLVEILSKYGKVDLVGKSYGVYKFNNEVDFTFPRTERKVGMTHKEFEVSVNPFMSYTEACKRRDFTINSILMNTLTEEIIDPFNGIRDLNLGWIHHTNIYTFIEDPLRVLRAVQFAARFNFKIGYETKCIMKELVANLKHLPKERIFWEVEKLLMKGHKPSYGFQILDEIGALEVLFPEIHELKNIEQGKKHHSEGNVYNHTMLALDLIPMNERTLDVMLAALCHDMGKGLVENKVDGDDIHFYGHAEATENAAKFLSRITDDVKLVESVLSLCQFHMRPYEMKKSFHRSTLRRLALKVDLKKLMQIHKADLMGRGEEKDYSHIEKILSVVDEIAKEIKPIIKGQHLIEHFKMKPGKHFGPFLKLLFEAQLEGKFNTVEGGIAHVNENWVQYIPYYESKEDWDKWVEEVTSTKYKEDED